MNERIRKALDLHNARALKSKDKRLLKWYDIGLFLFKDYNNDSRNTQVYKLKKGIRGLSTNEVDLLSEFLGVDPNFLHGLPSVHDEDFKKFKI